MKKHTYTLHPIKNMIIFQFEDEAADLNDGRKSAKGFLEKTEWGFVYKDSKASASNARWGIVVAAGPECVEQFQKGQRILIENLKWTEGVTYEGTTYWRTAEDHVLLVDDAK